MQPFHIFLSLEFLLDLLLTHVRTTQSRVANREYTQHFDAEDGAPFCIVCLALSSSRTGQCWADFPDDQVASSTVATECTAWANSADTTK